MNTENYYLEPNFASGKIKLAVKEYIPNNLRNILIVLHGMTEHMGRYEDFATSMCDVGIGVIGFDLPGHGASTSFGEVASFGEGNWESVVNYIPTFIRLVKEKYNCPVYIMGFSLGSFLLREYLATGPTLISGAIIVGTGIQPNIIIRGLECLVTKEIKKIGFDSGSDFIDNLSFGQYNKNIKNSITAYDWLCSDEESISEYASDEFCKKKISAGLFLQLLQSMRKTNDNKQYRTWNDRVPILIISGDEDPVGNNGKGPQGLYDQLNNHQKSIRLEIFPGRHDIFHEYKNRTSDEVVDVIIDFLFNKK